MTGAAVVVGYLAGSIPFTNLWSRWRKGVDLRDVHTGTVSGTSLYKVAGMGPLMAIGLLDVLKGTVGPLLARDAGPTGTALAAAAGVAGHNWSVFMRGAGGRGISPALGALAVTAWPGVVLLLGCLAVGRLLKRTAEFALFAYLALPPVLAATHGREGLLVATAIVVLFLTKRLAGNRRPDPSRPRHRVFLRRLISDRDRPEQV